MIGRDIRGLGSPLFVWSNIWSIPGFKMLVRFRLDELPPLDRLLRELNYPLILFPSFRVQFFHLALTCFGL